MFAGHAHAGQASRWSRRAQQAALLAALAGGCLLVWRQRERWACTRALLGTDSPVHQLRKVLLSLRLLAEIIHSLSSETHGYIVDGSGGFPPRLARALELATAPPVRRALHRLLVPPGPAGDAASDGDASVLNAVLDAACSARGRSVLVLVVETSVSRAIQVLLDAGRAAGQPVHALNGHASVGRALGQSTSEQNVHGLTTCMSQVLVAGITQYCRCTANGDFVERAARTVTRPRNLRAIKYLLESACNASFNTIINSLQHDDSGDAWLQVEHGGERKCATSCSYESAPLTSPPGEVRSGPQARLRASWRPAAPVATHALRLERQEWSEAGRRHRHEGLHGGSQGKQSAEQRRSTVWLARLVSVEPVRHVLVDMAVAGSHSAVQSCMNEICSHASEVYRDVAPVVAGAMQCAVVLLSTMFVVAFVHVLGCMMLVQ